MKTETQTVLPGIGQSLDDKVKMSIELLKTFEPNALQIDPENGYYLAFSGGKDSVVIKELAKMSGVRFQSVYNQTTIDPPELVRFIKEHHVDVKWSRPKRNFLKALVDTHGLPTRLNRWCCAEFKEQKSDGRVTILGVRAAESLARSRRWKPVSFWNGSTIICPILNWSDADVWAFIQANNLPYCSLYNEGWKRIGCVGCPMAGAHRSEEFARWPGFGPICVTIHDGSDGQSVVEIAVYHTESEAYVAALTPHIQALLEGVGKKMGRLLTLDMHR